MQNKQSLPKKNFNPVKTKKAVFSASALLLVMLALHNPTQGYLTMYLCSDCPSWLQPADPTLDFFAWESFGAIWSPIARIGTWLFISGIILVVTLLWLYFFCIEETEQDK